MLNFGVKDWFYEMRWEWKGIFILNYFPCFKTLSKKNFATSYFPMLCIFGWRVVCLTLFRVKNKCTDRSLDMLPNFNQRGFFWTINYFQSNIAIFMMLFLIRKIFPSFENRIKVYELTTIFQETDRKLRRWSKLVLLRHPDPQFR